MNASDYQSASNRTLITMPDRDIPQDELKDVLLAVEYSSRVAAITEYLKKSVFHQRGIDYGKLVDLYNHAEDAISHRFVVELPSVPMSRVMPLWVLSGLIGEAGEIAEIVIGYCLTGKVDKEKLKDETSDILWYVSSLCTLFGLDLGEVMQHNVKKLEARYPDGYNHLDSARNRAGE